MSEPPTYRDIALEACNVGLQHRDDAEALREQLTAALARITALEAVITSICHIPALKVETMTWLTWDDGREAAAAGKDLLANPCDPRTPVYAVWVQGWKHGMEARDG